MSVQQEAILEVMRELREFKRASEIQRVLQKQIGHSISIKSVRQSLKGLARSGLVELRKESGRSGRGGCCHSWRIKDMHTDLGSKQDKTIEEIKGLREDIQPEAIHHRQTQSDIRAIKDRLGMP